ncbi:nucleotidyltransferase substrate binding protein [Endozoicomonas sp. 2B-B]
MEKQQDSRWKQRFDNYQRALGRLQAAVSLSHSRELSELEKQGLIKAFEYTHELAWNTLKDFLTERGAEKMFGSRDVTRLAFKEGLIEQGETWMSMIKSRNLTSHTYREEVAQEIYENIINQYLNEFNALEQMLKSLSDDQP